MALIAKHETGQGHAYSDPYSNEDYEYHAKTIVPHLDSALKKATTRREFTVFTGTSFSPKRFFDHSEHAGKRHVIVHLPAYTSTSINREIANDFSKADARTPMHIDPRTKTPLDIASEHVPHITRYHEASSHMSNLESNMRHYDSQAKAHEAMLAAHMEGHPEAHQEIKQHIEALKANKGYLQDYKSLGTMRNAVGRLLDDHISNKNVRASARFTANGLIDTIRHRYTLESEHATVNKIRLDALNNIPEHIHQHLNSMSHNLFHQMAIHVPVGAHGLYMPDHGDSSYSFEREFLLPRNSKIKVSKKPICSIRSHMIYGRPTGYALWPAKLIHDGSKELDD